MGQVDRGRAGFGINDSRFARRLCSAEMLMIDMIWPQTTPPITAYVNGPMAARILIWAAYVTLNSVKSVEATLNVV